MKHPSTNAEFLTALCLDPTAVYDDAWAIFEGAVSFHRSENPALTDAGIAGAAIADVYMCGIVRGMEHAARIAREIVMN